VGNKLWNRNIPIYAFFLYGILFVVFCLHHSPTHLCSVISSSSSQIIEEEGEGEAEEEEEEERGKEKGREGKGRKGKVREGKGGGAYLS
jgi:hypothetical protein